MTQNAPNLSLAGPGPIDSEDGLTTPQLAALTALLAGRSVTAAAAQAAVSRSTLHRWLRNDWAFQAAYNRSKRELLETAQARLLELADAAITTVQDAISNGNSRAALAVLRGLGLLSSRPLKAGLEDPEELEALADIEGKRFHDRWLKSQGMTPTPR
jgi:hypothetical protein